MEQEAGLRRLGGYFQVTVCLWSTREGPAGGRGEGPLTAAGPQGSSVGPPGATMGFMALSKLGGKAEFPSAVFKFSGWNQPCELHLLISPAAKISPVCVPHLNKRHFRSFPPGVEGKPWASLDCTLLPIPLCLVHQQILSALPRNKDLHSDPFSTSPSRQPPPSTVWTSAVVSPLVSIATGGIKHSSDHVPPLFTTLRGSCLTLSEHQGHFGGLELCHPHHDPALLPRLTAAPLASLLNLPHSLL